MGIAALRSTVNHEGNILVALLRKLGTLADANIKADYTNAHTTQVEIKDAKKELIFQSDVSKIESWAHENITHQDGWRYFVVQEAIAAECISFIATSEEKTAIGGEAKFNEIVEANTSLSFEDKSESKLESCFSQPLRVCAKLREICASQGLDGIATIRLSKESVVIQPRQVSDKKRR